MHRLVCIATLVAMMGPRMAFAAGGPDERAGAAAPTVSSETQVSAEVKAEAKTRFARAVELYNEGQFEPALAEFERAYDLVHHYAYLYNIGQLNMRLGHFSKARTALQKYLDQGGAGIAPDRRAQVENDVATLVTRTATIQVDTEVSGADIVIDDEVVGKTPATAPFVVDAGERIVEIRKDGLRSDRQRIKLAGKEARGVTLRFAPGGATVAGSTPTKLPGWVYAGWVGVGVVGAGAAVTGALAMSSAYSARDLRQSPTSTPTEADDESSKARTLATVTDVLAGAALVGGGTMLYFTLTNSRHREAPAKVGAGFDGRQFSLTGTF